MCAEELRDRSRFLLIFCLQFLKESDQCIGIVTGCPHVLCSQAIGFFFGTAGKFEEGQRDQETANLLSDVSAESTEDKQRNRSIVEQLPFGHLLDAVTGRNMRDLVRKDAGHFRLIVGCLEQSAIDIEKAAREGEGVDVIRIDHLDREGDFSIGMQHNILRYPVDVFRDQRVGDEFRAPINLCGELATERYFFVQSIESQLTFVDIPLANQRRIILVLERTLLLIFLLSKARYGQQHKHHYRCQKFLELFVSHFLPPCHIAANGFNDEIIK